MTERKLMMSEQQAQEQRDSSNRIISQNKIGLSVGLVVTVLSAASAVGSWVILPFRVTQTEVAVREFQHSMQELKLENAASGASRFTAGDWMKVKTGLDEQALAFEKRISRLEDSVGSIRSQLDRIEKKLDGPK